MRISAILTAACILYVLPSSTHKGTINNKSAKDIEFTLTNEAAMFDVSEFDDGTIPAGHSITYDSNAGYLVKPQFKTNDGSVRNHNWHSAAAQAGGNWTIFDSKNPWGFDWNHSWK